MDKARHGARHTCCLMGKIGFSLIDRTILFQKHIARRRRWRGLTVVNEDLLVALCEVDQHKSAAADIARSGQRYGKGEASRYGSIDSVTTLLQHVEADLTGERLGADHHAEATIGGQEAILIIDDRRLADGRRRQRALCGSEWA